MRRTHLQGGRYGPLSGASLLGPPTPGIGWGVGRNVLIDTRADRSAKYSAELVTLAPDIVLASGTLGVTALQHISRTLPIVFAAVADPVGAGFVDSLARPGGNATGFMSAPTPPASCLRQRHRLHVL